MKPETANVAMPRCSNNSICMLIQGVKATGAKVGSKAAKDAADEAAGAGAVADAKVADAKDGAGGGAAARSGLGSKVRPLDSLLVRFL